MFCIKITLPIELLSLWDYLKHHKRYNYREQPTMLKHLAMLIAMIMVMDKTKTTTSHSILILIHTYHWVHA
jgi:hypothetical protein